MDEGTGVCPTSFSPSMVMLEIMEYHKEYQTLKEINKNGK